MTTMNDAVPEVTVVELTEAQGRELFEAACQKRLGVSTNEFLRQYDAEDIPRDWPIQDVQAIEFLLPYIR